MIQAHQSAFCVQSAGKVSRKHSLVFGSCRVTKEQRAGAAGHAAQSRGSNRAAAVVCRAEPEPVSGYTPADFITYSEDKQQQCHHNADIMVDAPLEQCYAAWSDWTKLLDTFDLIGQIGLDSSNPNMALFQCFYRFRKLPLMEIVFLLEREETSGEVFKAISFKSVYGMPMKGSVKFEEQVDGRTRIRLYFTHPVPNLLVQLQIGPFGVETDLSQILAENLQGYTARMEAERPADWEQQRQQVASRVSEVVSRLEVEKKQQQEQQQLEQERVQQQPREQQPLQQQAAKQQQQQQPEPPQQGVQPKQRDRTTASKAPSAAAVAQTAVAAENNGAAADAAAEQPGTSGRGRKPSRARTAAKQPAAAVAGDAADNGGSSGGAAHRRSRASSSAVESNAADASGNGPPPQSSSSGRPSSRSSRRTSKRASTAGRE